MNAERERNIDQAVGRLEAGQDHLERKLDDIIETLRLHASESFAYRQAIRDNLATIDRKIDPITVKVDALDRTVKAHETVLKVYAQREQRFEGAARLGKWLIHVAWFVGASLAVLWSDHLRPLIMFWK